METSNRLLVMILAALMMTPGRAAAQQGIPLEAGRLYAGGERLVSPWAGFSFMVPPEHQAQYDPALSSLVMQSPEMMLAVFGVSEAAPDALGSVAIDLLAEQGVRLALRQIEQPDDRTLRGTYVAFTPEGMGLTIAAAQAGPHGQAVAVFTLGPQGQEEALNDAVEAFLGSIEWIPPEAAAWRDRTAGRRFSTSGASSTYSPGGAGGYGSHASGTESALDLCSDGTYAFETRSESYISIEGASAEHVSSDAHIGRWRLIADVAGMPYLMLEAQDGRSFTWLVEETAEGAVIDGTAYVVAHGQRCR